MKKTIFLVVLCWATCISSFSQVVITNVWFDLDFENGVDSMIRFSPDTTSATDWKMGTPSKVNFDTAFSSSRAIITDTLLPYQPNTYTWFEIPVVPSNYDTTFSGSCPLTICFKHKLDFDSLHAGGWIDLRDADQSYNIAEFMNGVALNGDFYNYDMFYNSENIYAPWDTLFNDSLGFLVNSPTWTRTCYSIGVAVMVHRTPYDTVFFRFNFASDSTINLTHEGWMIDDIIIGKGYDNCAGGIEDQHVSSILLYPNPANQSVYLKFENLVDHNYQLLIYDMQGRPVLSKNNFIVGENEMNIGHLVSGLYFYRMFDNDHVVSVGKLLKE